MTNAKGTFTWASVGCLCDLNADYLENQVANWQHGLGYCEIGRQSVIQSIPITKGRLCFGDKEISG